MGKKRQSYSDIRTWAEKRAAKGAQIGGVAAALSAYEALKKEIKELDALIEEKRKSRATAFASLSAEYKAAKAAVKKAESAERKAAKAAVKTAKVDAETAPGKKVGKSEKKPEALPTAAF